MLTPTGGLSIAELAFFAPSLLFAILVVVRHGFSRQLGWFYIVVLCLLRLIGASCLLAYETQSNVSPNLLEAYFITSAVGTAPLLLTLLGFLERINQSMAQKGLSLHVFRPLHLLSLVGLILAIVGGTDESDFDAGSIATGRKLMQAACILFLVMFLALAAITLYNTTYQQHIPQAESPLLRAGVIAIPFLLVRIIYTVITGFATQGSAFYYLDPSVWPQAFMKFAMEAIIVGCFMTAGLMTPKALPIRAGSRGVDDVERDARVEVLRGPQGRQQRSRGLADYQPSRLIRDAIGGRR